MFVSDINPIKCRAKDSKSRCMYLIKVVLTAFLNYSNDSYHAYYPVDSCKLHAAYEVKVKALATVCKRLATVCKRKPNPLAT